MFKRILIIIIAILSLVSCKTNEIVTRTKVNANGKETYLYEVKNKTQINVFFDTARYEIGTMIQIKDSIIKE